MGHSQKRESGVRDLAGDKRKDRNTLLQARRRPSRCLALLKKKERRARRAGAIGELEEGRETLSFLPLDRAGREKKGTSRLNRLQKRGDSLTSLQRPFQEENRESAPSFKHQFPEERSGVRCSERKKRLFPFRGQRRGPRRKRRTPLFPPGATKRTP